jgi:hypothetical protein
MALPDSSIATDISEIQRRMAQIRLEMHQDVQGAVKGAQSLTDWRSLVRNHPWLAVGVAAAAGYLIVPHRAPRRQMLPEALVALPGTAPAVPRNQPANAGRGGTGTIGTVFALVAPVAVRAAQNYILRRFEEWLEHHPLQPARQGPFPRQETGPVSVGTTGTQARFREAR